MISVCTNICSLLVCSRERDESMAEQSLGKVSSMDVEGLDVETSSGMKQKCCGLKTDPHPEGRDYILFRK